MLIHISTDEVYGDILKGRSDENIPTNQAPLMLQVKLLLIILFILMLELIIFQQ